MKRQIAPAAPFTGPVTQQFGKCGPRGGSYDIETVFAEQIAWLVAQNRLDRGTREGINPLPVDLPDPLLRGLGNGAKPLLARLELAQSRAPGIPIFGFLEGSLDRRHEA